MIRILCIRHLSESRLLIGALHKRSKFANVCHENAKPFVVTTYEQNRSVYSRQTVLKNQIFSLFPIVKMNANYADILIDFNAFSCLQDI